MQADLSRTPQFEIRNSKLSWLFSGIHFGMDDWGNWGLNSNSIIQQKLIVKNARTGFWIILIGPRHAFVCCVLLLVGCLYAAEPTDIPVSTHTVDRKVIDFPTNEDLSTPEAAYAAFNRAWVVGGDAACRSLDVPELASTVPSVPKRAMPAKEAEEWLNAEVLEVDIYCKTNAGVFAKVEISRKGSD